MRNKPGVKIIMLLAFQLIWPSVIYGQQDILPVTDKPSAEAVALLSYIYSISGKQTIAGQHCAPLIGSSRLSDVFHDSRAAPDSLHSVLAALRRFGYLGEGMGNRGASFSRHLRREGPSHGHYDAQHGHCRRMGKGRRGRRVLLPVLRQSLPGRCQHRYLRHDALNGHESFALLTRMICLF